MHENFLINKIQFLEEGENKVWWPDAHQRRERDDLRHVEHAPQILHGSSTTRQYKMKNLDLHQNLQKDAGYRHNNRGLCDDFSQVI